MTYAVSRSCLSCTAKDCQNGSKGCAIASVLRSHHTLRREKLTRVKTPRPDLLKRNVVYKVPCLDYEKVYVGETKRNLKQRLMEHKGAVRREDRTNGIATHAWDKDHRVNWKRPEL